MTSFTDLGLAEPIAKALASEGYASPTPIQVQAIPPVMEGRDLIGLAQTGTGKTAAFALPILHRLSKAPRSPAGERHCRVLVLAPTRELAAQIGDSFRAYGRFLGLSTTVVFGGASMHKQRMALIRGVDVLVATPGRLIDHVEQRNIRLDRVEILVLDEADHMLDMGFIHALRRIAKLLPHKRQTLLFSATMPPPIAELAGQFLTDPVRVQVTPVSSTAERVQQAVVHVDQSQKQELLHALLADKTITRGLVFARTKHGADRIVRKLEDAGFGAEVIHGNKSQGQRTRALEAFKSGQARLLVATEIAARGIDVDGVSHVINFDLPNVPEQYVHRIGRTARAGADGMAVSFCAPDERPYLRDIERLTKQAVPVLEHPLGLSAEAVQRRPQGGAAKPAAPSRGRSQGQRNGPPRGRGGGHAGGHASGHGSGAGQATGQASGQKSGHRKGQGSGHGASQGAGQGSGRGSGNGSDHRTYQNSGRAAGHTGGKGDNGHRAAAPRSDGRDRKGAAPPPKGSPSRMRSRGNRPG